MADKIAAYLGLARRAGRLASGEQAVAMAMVGGAAKAIFLASDAPDKVIRRANSFIAGRRTLLLTLPISKAEFGRAIGKPACSIAAVTDIGLANSVVSSLREADPDRYAEAAELMDKRNTKAQRRRRETRVAAKTDEKKPRGNTGSK